MAKAKNMTEGEPGKLILLFALPLMAGNVCQQLYTMVDTAVVGRIVGIRALAALGVCEWFTFLVIGLIFGMTQGFSILTSQCFGAGDMEGLKKNLARSCALTGEITLVLMIVGQAAVMPVLRLLNTPEDICRIAEAYLRIIFAGMPISAAYNICASNLRALGNSKSPLAAMIIASVINIVLDLAFVGLFGWGVAGAAAATLIAQAFSAIYCMIVLRNILDDRITASDFRHEPGLTWPLLKLGAPIAFLNGIIAVGGMVVQRVINGYGALFIAGFTATNKLYGLLEVAATSYGYAITTYVGQNLGADNLPRIRAGVRRAGLLAVATAAVISVAMIAFGRPILKMFISGMPEETAQVLNIAYRYLYIMALFLAVLYLLYVFRSALQGLGNTLIPMISGFVEFAMRVAVAILAHRIVGDTGIYYVEITAWAGAAALLAAGYFAQMRKTEREAGARGIPQS